MIKRLSGSLLLAVAGIMLIATPVLAFLYRAPVAITENASTSYDMLPVMWNQNNTWLAANGFMASTANDTLVQTLAGLNKPHLVADNKTLTAIPVEADSQTNLYFVTGETPSATPFSIITGYNGYITIADAPNTEHGANFTETFTDIGLYGNGDIIRKPGAYNITKSSTNVTFEILNGISSPVVAGNTTTSVVGVSANWSITLPGSISNGDMLVILLGISSDRTVTFSTNNWTQIYFGSTVPKLGAWYKIADGTDAGTVNAIFSGTTQGGAIAYRITGASGTPEGGIATGTSTNPNPPLVTPTWGSMPNLYLASETHTGVDTPSGFPAGYSNTLTGGEGGAGQGISAAQLAATSSSEDPGTFTTALANNWVGGTVAIRPALVSATVTGIADGEYDELTVIANSANVWMDIDGSVSNNATVAAVPNTTNATVLMSNATPYIGSYTLAVGGVQQVRYEPNTIISGTTLPDRGTDGTNNDGVITWGTNPAGVGVTLGSFTSSGQSTTGTTVTETPNDILPPSVGQADFNLVPDVTGTLLTHPMRPLVTIWSDTTTLTETQAWRYSGILVVIFVTLVTARATRGHPLITGVACGGAVVAMVVQTIFPLGALVVTIIAIVLGLVVRRSPSL